VPIRWRLTLWFSLILCATSILSGVVIYIIMQETLNAAVDDNLRAYSARVHGILDTEEIPEPLDYDKQQCCSEIRQFGGAGTSF